MKSKSLDLVIILTMALLLMACGTAKKTSEPVEDNAEKVIWDGTLLASDKENSGQADEFGLVHYIIHDGSVDGDTFTVYGSMCVVNPSTRQTESVLDGDTHTFKVNKNTVYQLGGGEMGPQEVSQEEFMEVFFDCLNSGIGFRVELEDGVATTVEIYS